MNLTGFGRVNGTLQAYIPALLLRNNLANSSGRVGEGLTIHPTGYAWAAFDERTGRLDGTPGRNDLGRHEGVQITVTDGVSSVSLPVFVL